MVHSCCWSSRRRWLYTPTPHHRLHWGRTFFFRFLFKSLFIIWGTIVVASFHRRASDRDIIGRRHVNSLARNSSPVLACPCKESRRGWYVDTSYSSRCLSRSAPFWTYIKTLKQKGNLSLLELYGRSSGLRILEYGVIKEFWHKNYQFFITGTRSIDLGSKVPRFITFWLSVFFGAILRIWFAKEKPKTFFKNILFFFSLKIYCFRPMQGNKVHHMKGVAERERIRE